MAHERVFLKNHARLERALAVVEKHVHRLEFLRDQRGDVRMAVPVEIVHRRAERAGARQDDVLPELPPSPRSNHESRPMLLPYMLTIRSVSPSALRSARLVWVGRGDA